MRRMENVIDRVLKRNHSTISSHSSVLRGGGGGGGGGGIIDKVGNFSFMFSTFSKKHILSKIIFLFSRF